MEALKGFLLRAKDDSRLTPRHIALYVVLLDICADGERPGLFAIVRTNVMQKAHIYCRNTYYCLMRDLSQWGYIIYRPDRAPVKRSKVGLSPRQLPPKRTAPKPTRPRYPDYH